MRLRRSAVTAVAKSWGTASNTKGQCTAVSTVPDRQGSRASRIGPSQAYGPGIRIRQERKEPIMRVSEVMTRGVECVRPTDDIAAAAARMRDLDIGPLPVCGDADRLVGMLTDRDITVRAV